MMLIFHGNILNVDPKYMLMKKALGEAYYSFFSSRFSRHMDHSDHRTHSSGFDLHLHVYGSYCCFSPEFQNQISNSLLEIPS